MQYKYIIPSSNNDDELTQIRNRILAIAKKHGFYIKKRLYSCQLDELEEIIDEIKQHIMALKGNSRRFGSLNKKINDIENIENSSEPNNTISDLLPNEFPCPSNNENFLYRDDLYYQIKPAPADDKSFQNTELPTFSTEPVKNIHNFGSLNLRFFSEDSFKQLYKLGLADVFNNNNTNKVLNEPSLLNSQPFAEIEIFDVKQAAALEFVSPSIEKRLIKYLTALRPNIIDSMPNTHRVTDFPTINPTVPNDAQHKPSKVVTEVTNTTVNQQTLTTPPTTNSYTGPNNLSLEAKTATIFKNPTINAHIQSSNIATNVDASSPGYPNGYIAGLDLEAIDDKINKTRCYLHLVPDIIKFCFQNCSEFVDQEVIDKFKCISDISGRIYFYYTYNNNGHIDDQYIEHPDIKYVFILDRAVLKQAIIKVFRPLHPLAIALIEHLMLDLKISPSMSHPVLYNDGDNSSLADYDSDCYPSSNIDA